MTSAVQRSPWLRRGTWGLVALWALTLPLVNPYLRGDGVGYYAYLRSLVIDRDLNFEDEYRRGDPAVVQRVFDDTGQLRAEMRTQTGYVQNKFSVGPALFWAPWFLMAHGVVAFLNWMGLGTPMDGFAWPYRVFCALGTACYGLVALVLSYRLAARLVAPQVAWLATIGIWFASSFPVYMYFVPFQAHALAACAVAGFLWIGQRLREASLITRTTPWLLWGLLGFLGGLMVEVYYLNGVFLLIPLLAWIWWRPGCGSLAMFMGAALLALTPQFVIKTILYGAPWITGYEDRWFWASPRLWQVGFASEHGMFLWTPILIMAVLGWARLWRRDRWWGTVSALTGAMGYYVIASFQNWHGQSSFGSRFFVSWTPLLILGLAGCLEALGGRDPRRWACVVGLVGALVLWNVGLMFQWGTNLIPNRGPVDWRQMVQQQFTTVPRCLKGSLLAYLMDRERVIREVEEGDLEELRLYSLSR